MDFRDLQYMVAIAQHQSLTKAAEALYITQPTLSKFVKQTEELLGQKLFNRVGKKFILTYAGERYLWYANEILNIKKDMDQELAHIDKSKEAFLRVGFSSIRGSKMVLDIVQTFATLHPNIKLKLVEASTKHFENLLLSGELDLAFLCLPILSPKIEYKELGKEKVLIAASTKNPISEKAIKIPSCKYPWIDIQDTKNDKFIMVSEDYRLHNVIMSVFAKEQINPEIYFNTRNIEDACILASENFGLTFTVEAYIRHTHFKHLPALYSFGTPPLYRTYVAAYRKGSHLPRYAKDLIHLAKTHMVSVDADAIQKHEQNE
ncbi:MAG: LysR family transcriptional regulator [Christensenellaceae bacterium]|nr:LysR family transcriptional regulator [Christensenellaceae bacterium]